MYLKTPFILIRMSDMISSVNYKLFHNLQQGIHMTKKALILQLLIILGAVSCANLGRMNQVINPEQVNKRDLSRYDYEVTPEYDFRVTTVKELSGKQGKIITNVDKQFTEFSKCFGINDNGAVARKYLIAVVNGTFECGYHHGKCNGEFDPDNNLIIVAFKAFSREGILPVLKHEWAHAYRFLDSEDNNLKSVKQCTKY